MRKFRHLTPRYIINKTNLILYQRRYPDHPWLTQQANSILSTLLKKTDVALEWGAGRSTIWLARRVKQLTSVENDENWYKWVSTKLMEANITNVTLYLHKINKGHEEPIESPYVQVVNNFNKESLDMVLIDGKYRDVCANMVLDKICPGGIIIVDNVNRLLPHNSIAPASIPSNLLPKSKEWAIFLDRVANWRKIWTSNGVWDTAIWIKPADI